MAVDILKLTPRNSRQLQAGLDQVGTGQTYDELHVSGLTTIDDQILLNAGTRLTCDTGTIWKLMANASLAEFGEQVPMITQRKSVISGLFVDGLTIDGNATNQGKTPNDHGKGFGNAFGLVNVTDSVFQNITVQNNEGDGFRIKKGSGLKFYKNKGSDGGHDYFHLHLCDNVELSGNEVTMKSSNVLRVRGGHDINFHGNKCKGTKIDYGPAVQLELIEKGVEMYNVHVSGNWIFDTFGPGVWAYCNQAVGAARDITVDHNMIKGCGTMPKANKLAGVGGIVFDGINNLLIANNTIVDCFGYGIGYTKYVAESAMKGFIVTVRDNIVTGTRASLFPGPYSGSGIYAKDNHYTFKISGNCLYGNVRDYVNVKPGTGDILENPEFVDPSNGNYQLKDTSPCLRAGLYHR